MNNLAVIEENVSKAKGQIVLALGGSSSNDPAFSPDAARYIQGVMMEVKKSVGKKTGDLSLCNPQSIVQAAIDAARMRVDIDGRQHAHLVAYGDKVSFQMGYRGYLAKIKEVYPDASFDIKLVFEGDELDIGTKDGVDYFNHKPKDPFNENMAQFKGILFAVTYAATGRLNSKVSIVPKSRIERARKAAKQDHIWSSDYFEKAKAAAIKAACKHMFASIQGLQELIQYDNERNFNVDAPAVPEKGVTIVDNLNAAITGDDISDVKIDDNDVIDIEPRVIDDEYYQRLATTIAMELKLCKVLSVLEEVWLSNESNIESIRNNDTPAYSFLMTVYETRRSELGENA